MVGRLFQLRRPVPVREVSTGHLGNGLEPQQTEGRENISCGNFVFCGSIFCLEYIADFGTGYLYVLELEADTKWVLIVLLQDFMNIFTSLTSTSSSS